MKKRFSLSIRLKISIILVGMIILLAINAITGIKYKSTSINTNNEIKKVYMPLAENLMKMDGLQKNASRLSSVWIENRQSKDKLMLQKIIVTDFPEVRLQLGRHISQVKQTSVNEIINKSIEKFDLFINYEKQLLDRLAGEADFDNAQHYDYANELVVKNIIPQSLQVSELLSEAQMEVRHQIKILEDQTKHKSNVFTLVTFGITGIVVALIVYLIFYIPGILITGLKQSGAYIKQMAAGSIPEIEASDNEGEVSEIKRDLISLGAKMQGIVHFATQLGNGNLKAKAEEIANWGNIGFALNNMRKSLETISDKQEERRKEEELNTWITTGIAHFNEILRMNSSDTQELSYVIIKELVKYIGAVIGGVYIVKKNLEGIEKLEMSGLFAYERKRYVEVEIEPGEGLIGTCYVERHKIHMNEVPDNYLKISSGLGEANPNEILIVPLMYNDIIHGVIELATLDSFSVHSIEFVEKIAEGLASTISATLINSETARLLEESNEKAEKLHSQEEELRQNMEELQAAQEERERQNKQVEASQRNLEEIIQNIPLPVFVKDEEGKYLIVNKEQEKLLGKMAFDIIGKDDTEFVQDESELEMIKSTDTEVIKQKKRVDLPEQKLTLESGKTLTICTMKIPILNNITCQINILGLSYFK